LGGVMMLFMIVVAVKGRVEFGPAQKASSPGAQNQSPFAVVVVATGPRPLFKRLGAGDPGPFEIKGPAQAVRTARKPSGERYAMFLSDRPPDGLAIGPFVPDAEAEVQVFHLGRRLRAEKLGDLSQRLDPKGMLSVWPVPEAATVGKEDR
jgi:hypothetical protein